MRIALLGGTGRSGREVARQALARGHEVAILGRHPDRLGTLRGQVSFTHGDVADGVAIESVMTGAEAVVSTIGPTGHGSEGTMEQASENSVAAMGRLGIRRIVVLTNTAIHAPSDRPTLTQKLISLVLEIVIGKVTRDHRAQARILLASGLDWTIVRAPRVADRPPTGKYTVGGLDSTAGTSVARADLAAFILDCVTGSLYKNEFPLVSQ